MSYAKSTAISQKWQEVLSDLVVQAEGVAQSSQRKRKMSVEQLVQTLVLGCLEREPASLRLWSEVASDLGCDITASSIDERLSPRLVVLLYEVLQQSIQSQLDVSKLPVEKLHQFSRVVLYDSTAIGLPPVLKWAFRGSSTTGLGHMKVQVGYDYLNAQLCALTIHEGREPDQTDEGFLKQALEDTLMIFDLGYFEQSRLASIDAQGAYFVTRYQSQTGLYDVDSLLAVDLLEHLAQTPADCFEADYKLGRKAKVPVRLVARRVSTQEASQRRREVKRKARNNGHTASQRSLTLCDWDILITNLSHDWTAQQIMDLYCVRWQIELIFKAWKSYLEVTNFGYWRVERVVCQLYASLIGAVLCHMTFASVRYFNSEASLFKAFRIIQRHVPHLLQVIRRNWWGLKAWTRKLRQHLLKFGQQQNLKTTHSSLSRLINWE